MLCQNCANRQSVQSKEVGTVFERCSVHKVALGLLGDVTKCTSYEAKNLPWVFANAAWILSKDDNGEFFFMTQEGDRYQNGKKLPRRPE